MMTFEAPMYLTGDEPLAGYCGGCGEYVGLHHVCQPVGDGKVRVPLKPCCGLLDGDECDCAELTAQMQAAPVVYVGTGWYR